MGYRSLNEKGIVIMKNHDKISFTREYCRCRGIRYRVKGEALFLGGTQVCFSLLNLDYTAIIAMIDAECHYDQFGRFEAFATSRVLRTKTGSR